MDNNDTMMGTPNNNMDDNNNHEDESAGEDESNRSGSQLSLVSSSQHSQSHGHRSRNNSEMSQISDDHNSSAHGGSGGLFFADMTLDLNMAQMETTPRTDMKFASMAKNDIVGVVPPMPLIEEPTIGTSRDAIDDAPAAVSNVGRLIDPRVGSNEDGNHGDADDNDMAAESAIEMPEQRSFQRIGSDSHAQTLNGANGSGGYSQLNSASSHSFSSQHRRPARTPRRPRDVSWTAAALLVMPVGLFLPHIYYSNGWIDRHNRHPCHEGHIVGGGGDSSEGEINECHPTHPSWSQTALAPSTHTTVLFSSLAATALSLFLLRLLYSYPGGGEGDDRRHVHVTRTLLLASNLCIWLNPALAFGIWVWLPSGRVACLLPLGLMVRDGFRVKSSGSSLPRNSTAGRMGGGRLESRANPPRSGGAGASSAMSSSDRKTFFRALAVASLDILSRALRRKSFVRAASIILLVQFVCTSLWWGALSVVLSVEIFEEDGVITRFMHFFWLVVTLVSGKWATGTIARLLGFVASGGVASWFASQTAIIERMMERQAREEEEQRQRQQQQKNSSSTTSMAGESSAEQADATNDSAASNDPASNYAAARAALHAMPEAYRSADASAYASVMDFDEGLDDDYEEDMELGGGAGMRQPHFSEEQQTPSSSSSTTTVKAFLAAGCTVSFGSVAQCGLLGGLAQFLWSLVRNIDAMGFFLQRRFTTSSSGFRGMEISSGNGTSASRRWKQTLAEYWRKADTAIRGFVRSHSDLAMSHVASYFKSYQRAANDVAVLIETSGVESIIHDDITTHMCSSLGHLLAGSIVLFFGMLLVTHRNTFSTRLTDVSVLEVLLFTYVLCYTILFTVLEPLRAAIKAVYVCFAEHPESLSQAFPLIYQRLKRISESSC